MKLPGIGTCREHRKTLGAIVDGRESAAARESLSEHATACSRCAAEQELSLRLRRVIESAPTIELDKATEDDFVNGVLGRLDAPSLPNGLQAGPSITNQRRRRVITGSIALSAAIAAAATLVVNVPSHRTEAMLSEPAPSGTPQDPPLNPPLALHAEVEIEAPQRTHIEFEVETAIIELAPATFRTALVDASVACAFDPARDTDSLGFAAALVSNLQGGLSAARHMDDVAIRCARRLLNEEPTGPLAALAARVLGPRADVRDRHLLEQTLPETGLAGVLALGERGAAGIDALWRVACGAGHGAPTEPTQILAIDGLELLSAARQEPLLPSRGVDLNLTLAARIVSASGAGASQVLLDRYLADGHEEWLDRWWLSPGRDDSLASAVARVPRARQSRTSKRSDVTERMLVAIKRAQFEPGLAYTIDALEQRAVGAAATLAALPGDASLNALLGVSLAGRLDLDAEELAWSTAVAMQPDALIELAASGPGNDAERTDFIMTRLVLGADREPRAGWVLARIGLDPRFDVERRVRALLLATEGDCPQGPDLVAPLVVLTRSSETKLAAAAWIVLDQIGQTEPMPSAQVLRALQRPSTPPVKHLRIVRAIEREHDDIRRRTRPN